MRSCVIGCQQQELGVASEAESAVSDVNDPSDQQVEMVEQERLVLQLKEMIRDRENALAGKDAELKVCPYLVCFVTIIKIVKILHNTVKLH